MEKNVSLHSFQGGQVNTEKLWKAAELELQKKELYDGEGGGNARQYVWTSLVIRFAIQIEERNPFKALNQKFENVFVESRVKVVSQSVVDVGKDEPGNGDGKECECVCDVKFVE